MAKKIFLDPQNCNYIFIHQVALARRQRKKLIAAVELPPSAHLEGFTLSLIVAHRQILKLWISIFMAFGVTRAGIEPILIASVPDALSSR